jgi:predicted O-methyltransferase YrrM
MPIGYLLQKYHQKKHSQPIYSVDWFSHHLANWNSLLGRFKHKPDLLFLEIGSYEGRSTRWLLENVLTHATSRIYCIDTWQGNMEHHEDNHNMSMVRKNFLHNIRPYKKKVTCFINPSQEVIRNNPGIFRTERFDFIYIDGSHVASDVLEDAIYSFRLLKQGGLLLFDDYIWDRYQEVELNPRLAIDCWLACFKGQYQLLHKETQVCVMKL